METRSLRNDYYNEWIFALLLPECFAKVLKMNSCDWIHITGRHKPIQISKQELVHHEVQDGGGQTVHRKRSLQLTGCPGGSSVQFSDGWRLDPKYDGQFVLRNDSCFLFLPFSFNAFVCNVDLVAVGLLLLATYLKNKAVTVRLKRRRKGKPVLIDRTRASSRIKEKEREGEIHFWLHV